MPISDKPSLMREVIDKMDYMVRIMDADHKVIYMNQKMMEKFGYDMGHICYALLEKEENCEHCVTKESKETGKTDMKNVPIGDRFYNIISSPVSANSGENYSIEIFNDITEQKKIEDELMRHYEKLKADIAYAKNIQSRTLPIDGVYWDALEINSIYHPSEDLGGDLFDVLKVNSNEILIYIADVSGHGITSSLTTIFLRQMIRGRVSENKPDLKELLELLQKGYGESGVDKEQYLTILFCLYNKEKREVTFLNAGHNCMPIIARKTGEVEQIEVTGMPVCSLEHILPHKEVVIPVEPGDRIILYTDGITEGYNEKKEYYATERILEIIRNNIDLDGKVLALKVVDDAESFSKRPSADDTAIMIAKVL